MTRVDADELTILYDERCAFCLRCRDWLATQPVLVRVRLLASGSEEAQARFTEVPGLGTELVVADEAGRVWIGPDAFLMCLWATARYRSWSYRLTRPAYARFAESFFLHVSKRRGRYAEWLGQVEADCTYCDDVRMRRGE